MFKILKCSNFKIFRIVRNKNNEKQKGNEKSEENSKTKKAKKMKKKKPRKKRKTHLRRINGPAQRRAHACGAEFRPTNGRSIGIAARIRQVEAKIMPTTNSIRLVTMESIIR
jgi:hypothetical protein